jgi:hypothetical protein
MNRFGFTLLAVCLSFPVAAEVVRIPTTDRDVIASLQADYDFWGIDWRKGYVILHVDADQRAELAAAGYSVETDPIRQRELARWQSLSFPRLGEGSGTISGFPCYRTVDQTHADLAALAAAHPDEAEWIDIGDTWQADAGSAPGDSIYALRIGRSASPQPPLVVSAAQHARELATAEIATRLAELLVENPDNDPDIDWLLDHREIHIIAQHNPDGRRQVEAGDALWRKNHNETVCPTGSWPGVDLNRNGSFLWGPTSTECSQTHAGPVLASEPETIALQQYLAQVFEDQRPAGDLTTPAPDDTRGVFISLHSFGGFVLIPWEGLGGQNENNAPNHDALTLLGRRFGYLADYAVGRWQLLPPATGTAVDYAYGEFGVAAFTFEVGTSFQQPCASFESTIWPDNRDALLLAARAARAPYLAPSGPAIENLAVEVSDGVVTLTGTAADDRYFGGIVTEPPQPNPVDDVVAIRVSVDAPEAETGQAVVFELPDSASTVNFSVQLPIVDLPSSPTRLFVTGEDATGRIGLPRVARVSIQLIYANGFESIQE